MASLTEALQKLRAASRPEEVVKMAGFGMTAHGRLGVSVPAMRRIAKEIGRNHVLALALWRNRIPEAKMVACMIEDPDRLTAGQMEAWVADFDSWDVCDQVCMNLFEKSPLAWRKLEQWARREEEYVKRAAFALTACLAWHDTEAEDERFLALLPMICQGATDERNFVKKAVSWALRTIGKRNRRLNSAALKTAREIQKLDSRAARWIAADSLRELTGEAVKRRFGL